MKIKATRATKELMKDLEHKGVITRLAPGRQRLKADIGQSVHKSLYASEDFGPHKIITVTINKTAIDSLIYHNDHEEFWIIDQESEPLVIVFSLLNHKELEEKMDKNALTSSDLMALIMPKNDPEISFFIMHKRYPHMECVLKETLNPPSFFVTECRDIDECKINIKLEVE